ncbi:hypothetical protein MYX82_01980 [Acidobacteria bacterium AH-259-D05]|nr:hypothetical protein [Acidobacteria bacterium AH-259-D05]
MNPKTAQQLGLRDRDLVVVESEIGAIPARVKLFAGVSPDSVCLPLGLGHRIGTFAQMEGGNPIELLRFRHDSATGVPLWNLEKVGLRKE